jgi:hypothetical protein
MGYQQGSLLRFEIVENTRAFRHFYEQMGISYDDFLDLWNIQKNYVPQNMIDFIQGTADGSEMSFEEIAVTWVYEGAVYYKHCCSLAAWGPATSTNELIHASSMDWDNTIQDPVTEKYVQENPVLIVADPDIGYAFMYPTFAGWASEGGINEKGISVCNMWSPSNDRTPYGAPMGIRLLEALYYASTAERAIDFITTNKTFGYNFLICDGKIPIGYAVETTANLLYVGTWNDSVESISPFWEIDHVVRRTNCYIDPEITATQRDPYSPRDLSYILIYLGLLKGKKWVFITWNHYKALSKGMEKHWGNMDLNNTMSTLQEVYQLKHDIIWRTIIQLLGSRYETWWQWVACPKTGNILVSFASADKNAWENPVHYFNMFELLDSKPP